MNTDFADFMNADFTDYEKKMIVCLCNQKGGVGKTSLTLHICGALAEMGRKVLAVDMDQQGNLSSVFFDDIGQLKLTINEVLGGEYSTDNLPEAIYPSSKFLSENLYILPANYRLRGLESRLAGMEDSDYLLLEELNEIKDEYDYIFIDCPTGLGKPTRLALVAADFVLVPTECLAESVQGINQVNGYIEQVQKRANPELKLLGLVINRYDKRRAAEQSYRDQLRKEYGSTIFRSEFYDRVNYAEAMMCKMPITLYKPNSDEAFMARMLMGEIMGRIDRLSGNKQFN